MLFPENQSQPPDEFGNPRMMMPHNPQDGGPPNGNTNGPHAQRGPRGNMEVMFFLGCERPVGSLVAYIAAGVDLSQIISGRKPFAYSLVERLACARTTPLFDYINTSKRFWKVNLDSNITGCTEIIERYPTVRLLIIYAVEVTWHILVASR